MPDRCSIFKDWANYCGIEMEKQVSWDSSSFKLFQKIEPFTIAFEVMLLMCTDQERFMSR